MRKALLSSILLFSALAACREAAEVAREDEFVSEKTGVVTEGTQLVIAPIGATMYTGDAFPLTAYLFLPYGKVQDVSREGEWRTSAPNIINPQTGGSLPEAIALALGTAEISFTYQGLDARSTWTVAHKRLERVFFQKTEQNILLSRTPTGLVPQNVRLSLVGVYSDGSTQELNGEASWAVSDPSQLEVTAEAGVFLVKSVGRSQVTARHAGVDYQIAVQSAAVDRELVSLRVRDTATILPLNTPEQLTVEAVYNDQTIETISALAQITVSDASLLEYTSSTQRLLGKALGSTDVRIRFQNLEIAQDIRVVDATQAALRIEAGGTLGLSVGTSQQLRAMLELSDGTLENVTSRVTWTSSQPTIVEVSASENTKGLVIGRRTGSAQVIATWSGLRHEVTMPVGTAVPVSLTVTSEQSGTLALYLARDFKASARLSDGQTADVTSAALWSIESSGGNGFYEPGFPGRFASNFSGSLLIKATIHGVSATLPLVIGPVAPVLLQIQNLPSSIRIADGPRSLVAMVTLSDGNSVVRTQDVAWSFAVTGDNLSFAGYCENTTGRKGICTPIASGRFRVIVRYPEFGLTSERIVEVVP